MQRKYNEELIENMTLEEKARLVNGATFFGSCGVERLGVPRMQLLDGGTGINFEQLFGDMEESMIGSTALCHVIEYFFEPDKLDDSELNLYHRIKSKLEERTHGKEYSPGCFPPGILLGATWNPDVIKRVGEALGMEACVYGVHILLGSPNVNIHRDPLNGRLFEGYSEDPCLVSGLAPELVKGVQKYGVAANVKHFAANNQETNRVGINEQVSKRALEEIYFSGFKACVKEGGVKTVMSAYNKINGVPCTENRWLLLDKLRNEWGFDGIVISDWGAVYHPVEALESGNDLAMPGPIDWNTIAEAVENERLSESVLDDSVRRILHLIQWLDENYQNDFVNRSDIKELKEFTDKAAYEAACEGIVMLKNDGIMPIRENLKVYIAGSGSEKLVECGSGSAGINTDRTGNLYSYLASYLGEENVSIGLPDNNEDFHPDENSIALCICSLGGMEGNDRTDLKLLPEDIELISDLEIPVVLILNTCGPVDLRFIDKRENIHAIFETFLPGMEGSHALADILTGRVNPSGKLPITFPAKYEDAPSYLNFPGDGYEVNYGEGIYVGYRYYDRKKIKPMYAFGYGLSYTQFLCELTDVELAENHVIRVGVSVTNTGAEAGSEVVQIYIGDPYSTLSKPVKELKAFKKVYIKPGDSIKFTVELPMDALASYDSDLDRWIVEEGYYDIYAAVSSRDEDVFGSERIYIDVKSPYSYSVNSAVKIICEQPELRKLAYELWSRQGWDTAMLDSNYQYTSGRKLSEVMDDISNDSSDTIQQKDEFVRAFNENAAKIIKM